MNANHKPKHAFTLIELLVVMSVIAILMGLLFPALNMIRQRAWDTAARNLCLQTCVAWNSLLMEHRRYPPVSLFKDTGNASGGDVEVLMDTEATSLLNWWKPRSPDPTKDAAAYAKWLSDKKIIFNSSGFGIQNWPKNLNDLYLERTSEQRKWGLIAPWVRRYISNLTETTIDDENIARVKAGTVRVLLDTSGDGKITLPPQFGGQVLNKTVVAWVYADEKESRIVQTW